MTKYNCPNCGKEYDKQGTYNCECGYDIICCEKSVKRTVVVDRETYSRETKEKIVEYNHNCTKCKHHLKRDEYFCPECNTLNFINDNYEFTNDGKNYEFSIYEEDSDYGLRYNLSLNSHLICKREEDELRNVIEKITNLIKEDRLIFGKYGIMIKERNGSLDVFDNNYIYDNLDRSKHIKYEISDKDYMECTQCNNIIDEKIMIGSDECKQCKYFDCIDENYQEVCCNYRRF